MVCCCDNPERCCRDCKKNNPVYTTYTWTNSASPCFSCPHYNKPYWGIISPCAGCPHGNRNVTINYGVNNG